MVGEAEHRRSIRSFTVFGQRFVKRAGFVVEQDRTSYVDQHQLLLTQFSVHFDEFLTIGIWCEGLIRL